MKNFTRVILCLSVLMYGCSPYYYAPNKSNVPNLRERNDMRVDAGFGGGWVMRGADLQTAYALGSHIGIMANGAVTNSRYTYRWHDGEEEKTQSWYAEGGLGYFTRLEDNDNWCFEIYGGAGKGEYKIMYSDEGRARLNMKKYFVQPSLTFTHPRRGIELSIGSRFSGVDYQLGSVSTSNNYDFQTVYHIVDRPLLFYWEPSFRFSAGSKAIKGFVSVTPTISILDTNIPREVVNLNLGIRFTFNTSPKD